MPEQCLAESSTDFCLHDVAFASDSINQTQSSGDIIHKSTVVKEETHSTQIFDHDRERDHDPEGVTGE